MIEVIERTQELKLDKSSWKLTKLGDLAEDISKRVDNPSASAYDRFVGLEHFVSGDIKIKNWGTTENLASSAKAFQAGDILFARRNAYLRRASIVDFDGCCSGDAFVIRENHNKVVPGFLAFLMNSDTLWDYANSNAAGTMSKRVKWRDLAEYEFLLPPKEEQAKLAELLWSMDEVIEREKKVLETTSNFKISYAKDLFNGKIRLNGKTTNFKKSSLGDIPIDWDIKRIGEVCEVKGGKRLPKGYCLQDIDNGNKYITVSDMNYYGINTDKIKFVPEEIKHKIDRYRVQKEDIYISVAGTIGLIGMIPEELDGAYLTENADKLVNVTINKHYLMLFMRSDLIQNQIDVLKTVNAQPKLALTRIREFEIIVPSNKEQDYIVHQFSSLNSSSEGIKEKIIRSKTLQKSLINQVFSSSVSTTADI